MKHLQTTKNTEKYFYKALDEIISTIEVSSLAFSSIGHELLLLDLELLNSQNQKDVDFGLIMLKTLYDQQSDLEFDEEALDQIDSLVYAACRLFMSIDDEYKL